MKDILVWIDCEMTGLSLENDALIEIATLVTDYELNVLGDGVDVIIKPPTAALEQMDEFVTNMHTSSGLITELDSGVTLEEAEDQVLDFIREYATEPGKVPLAGNSIATDRAFIARDMTKLDNWLHYRMVDVSSIKMLAKNWYPRAYFNAPEKGGNHRALADIIESIEELRYYRSTVFWPEPGISSDDAKAAAAAIKAARA